ncbi:MAG: ferrochelatase [Candidatus Binatia bacterium]|jgi:ferrochelatase
MSSARSEAEASSRTGVLLVAFGGPDAPEEIRPFLDRVLEGVWIPPSRIEEVVRHYEAVGGRSPLTELTFKQARALQSELGDRGRPLPVYVGLRHSKPFLRDALEQLTADGVERILGLILSPHRTEASWEKYQNNVAAARAELGDRCPPVEYCPGWHAHPLFIQAWTELIGFEIQKIRPEQRGSASVVFTAHSVPVAMAERSGYAEQIRETASLIGSDLGHCRWSVAYQSRSGNPKDPWLEPDVLSVIRDLAANGATEVIVAPIGFVCDHVEVLYDLDLQAREVAEDLGLGFYRARCVNDHPLFIRMMGEIIEGQLRGSKIEDRG